MDLRDKDGGPLVHWHDPQSAFEAWKECSRGRPCDYSGLTYDLLRERGGIQWPCTPERPEGTPRLYEGGRFFAHPDYCESYGRDLLTGAPMEETEYRATNPEGRALIKAAEYVEPHEVPSEEHPLQLTTGRTLYHFHTRTKTARAPELDAAAPDVWVEVSEHDAAAAGLAEGDLAEVSTPRGSVQARVRVSGVRRGVLFLPFHYGYWDTAGGHEPSGPGRAANELTMTTWDPVSKQPVFKTAAAAIRRAAAGDGTPAPAPTTAASAPADDAPGTPAVPATRGVPTAGALEELEDVATGGAR